MTADPDPATVTVGAEQRYGRTWPDLLHPFVLVVLLIASLWALRYFGVFDVLAEVPLWSVIAVLMSLIWLPWLIAQAKEGATLVLVMDGIETLSEWRIGSHYPIDIEGVPLNFFSRSGVRRLFLTSFDPATRSAEAFTVPGGTPFDFIRDGTAFIRLAASYSKTLRDEQIVKEMVGVEAQRASGRVADQMLRILHRSMDLSELEAALVASEASAEVDPAVGAGEMEEDHDLDS